MIRLTSVNLNKRLNSLTWRNHLTQWLLSKRVDVVVAQEPWKKERVDPFGFAEWVAIGGNDKVYSWINSAFEIPTVDQTEDIVQRMRLGFFTVFGVYLDAYSQEKRASQLKIVDKLVAKEGDRPILIVGDFNIAPCDKDGIVDGRVSTFNSDIDRAPLKHLIARRRLIDLGSPGEGREWTIERKIGEQVIKFRCDLALVSDYMVPDVKFLQDDSVRRGEGSFTDHSALLIDLPITLVPQDTQQTLFPKTLEDHLPNDAFDLKPERTAIHRSSPTPIAREIVKRLVQKGTRPRILDFGCGYGRDVQFYRSSGLRAEGYDPHAEFGWSTKPVGKFDIVCLQFVLNVLPDPYTRLTAIKEAASYIEPDGILVVVTRSREEILRHAKAKRWPVLNDGYWSDERRGMFQRGMTEEDILRLASRCHLELSPSNELIRPAASATCVLLRQKT